VRAKLGRGGCALAAPAQHGHHSNVDAFQIHDSASQMELFERLKSFLFSDKRLPACRIAVVTSAHCGITRKKEVVASP
jgi:hypothetical protein